MRTRSDRRRLWAARVLALSAALLAPPGLGVANEAAVEAAEEEAVVEKPAPAPPSVEPERRPHTTRGAEPASYPLPPAAEATRVPDPDELDLQRVPDPDEIDDHEADAEPRPAP